MRVRVGITVLMLVLLAVGGSPGGFCARATATATAVPEPDAWEQTEADRLTEELVSQDPAAVATALSSEAAAVYAADQQPIIPAGSTLTIDAASFEQTGGSDAVVVGTLDGQDVLLLLVAEGDRWLLLTTVGA